MTSVKEIRKTFHEILAPLYGASESHALGVLLLEFYLKKDKAFLLAAGDLQIESETQDELMKSVARLAQHEPIQYVLGEAFFLGRRFYLNPAVLIPRPETEELVLAAIKRCTGSERILDIGTGSGVIAITLALEVNGCHVFGLDNSDEVLAVAQRNSEIHHANVDFIRSDFLQEIPALSNLDLIISNPPYVTETDKLSMKDNVINYEPPDALFVPEEDPLIFYKRIAVIKNYLLKPGGVILVEINEAFGKEVAQVFDSAQATSTEIIHDINGKERVVLARF